MRYPQFTLGTQTVIKMKFLIVACVVATCAALPVEDTPEVKAAKAQFEAQFRAAEQGMHAQLAPVQGPTQYLADDPNVAKEKEMFNRVFDATERRDKYNLKVAEYKEKMYRQYAAWSMNPYLNAGAYSPYAWNNGYSAYNGFYNPAAWNMGYSGAWAHPYHY